MTAPPVAGVIAILKEARGRPYKLSNNSGNWSPVKNVGLGAREQGISTAVIRCWHGTPFHKVIDVAV